MTKRKCQDCGNKFPSTFTFAVCDACKAERRRIHALHCEQPPLSVEQESEERERRMTHKCHAPR